MVKSLHVDRLQLLHMSHHQVKPSLMMKSDMLAENKARGYRPLAEGLLAMDPDRLLSPTEAADSLFQPYTQLRTRQQEVQRDEGVRNSDNMKTPSVWQLLGVSVLLVSALIVCAVFFFWPPVSPTRSFVQLMVVMPYCISTIRMTSVLFRVKAGLPKANSKEMIYRSTRRGLVGGDQEFEEDYDDVDADVIEHDV